MLNFKETGLAVVGAAAIGLSVGVAPAQAISFNATSNFQGNYTDFTFTGEDSNADGFLDGFEISAFSGVTLSGLGSDFNGTYDVLGRVIESTNFFSRFSLATLSWESTFDNGVNFSPQVIFDTSDGSLPISGPGIIVGSGVWTYSRTSTPVPTPALLPGLIGMGIGTLRKKRKGKAAEQAVEPTGV